MFSAVSDSSVRYDAILVTSIRNGNPNGNPDMGNTPRQTLDGRGLVSDVSTKRRIRDHVAAHHSGDAANGIFVSEGETLQDRIDSLTKKTKKTPVEKQADAEKAIAALVAANWDIRMFGSVLSIGSLSKFGSYAKIQGPAHVTFGESIDPVRAVEHAIGRVVHAEKADAGTFGDKQAIESGVFITRMGYNPSGTTTINNKFTVDAHRISKERTDADLALLWEGAYHLYAQRSAAIGDANVIGLVVFKHSSSLGDAPAHHLFERVSVVESPTKGLGLGVAITVDDADLPAGISVHVF